MHAFRSLLCYQKGDVCSILLYLNCKTEITKAKTRTSIISTPLPLLDQRLDEITAGLPASYGNNLRLLDNQENISTIIRYVQAMKTETSLSNHYRKDNIELLTRFSKFNDNKSFNDITRDDIIAFLDSFRKPESVDPLHKWIGTYNQYRMHLVRFFKWLYYPDIECKKTDITYDYRKYPTAEEKGDINPKAS